jgi:hypothetical protein
LLVKILPLSLGFRDELGQKNDEFIVIRQAGFKTIADRGNLLEYYLKPLLQSIQRKKFIKIR